MLTVSLEESVDANAEDILDFLAREVQYIHPDKKQFEQPEILERTINFYGECRGNIVSIFVKSCESARQGEEAIKFEIIPRSETMSVIKAFYECNNSHIVLKFYKIWSRVGVAFGASFAGKALRKMQNLKEE